jgi:hypothetical protein
MDNQINVALRRVILGVGNPNHEHVHRHNILKMQPMHVDQLMTEQRAGGIRESTLNAISGQAGGLTVQPNGFVAIEDTYNQRRGLGMLEFATEESALRSTKLVVLGYLVGGEPRDVGIDPATRFQPVRCWEIDTSNKTDFNGYPTIQQSVTNSHQFLQGHPNKNINQRSMRPIDIGNEVLGYVATESENSQDGYGGNVLADLNKGIVISKTQNLDTTHHAKQLMKIAGNALTSKDFGMDLHDSIAESIYSGGMAEANITRNAFFMAMSQHTGMWNQMGFNGFSLGEIASVFENFVDVMNMEMIDNPPDVVDNIGLTNAYGSTTISETTAQEIAVLCADLAIRTGVTFCTFSATNNPDSFGGFMEEDGVAMLTGEWMSIIDSDPFAINRLEKFKQAFKDRFFTKYNTGYAHDTTIVNVIVTCAMFGETSVQVFFNGDESTTQSYTNATYYLSRTSTNIAATDAGIAESVSFLNNIREYFAE